MKIRTMRLIWNLSKTINSILATLIETVKFKINKKMHT